jgi:hypothetical protein
MLFHHDFCDDSGKNRISSLRIKRQGIRGAGAGLGELERKSTKYWHAFERHIAQYERED